MEQKRGEGKQRFLKRGQAKPRGGCLKKGGDAETPLQTMELDPVPADITEDVLEENVCKALSVTGVNVVPNYLYTCH